MGDTIASRPGMLVEANPRIIKEGEPAGTGFGGDQFYRKWLDSTRVPGKRVNEMKYYDALETEIPDVRKALDAFATMAVTGNLAGGGRSGYSIRPTLEESHYPDEIKDRFTRLELLMRNVGWTCIREMVKYGSYTPAVVPGRMSDNRMGVSKIKAIPPGTMFRHITSDGGDDPTKYWYQKLDGEYANHNIGASREVDKKTIPQWLVPHFAVWSNVVDATSTRLYGTSLLQPFGAIGLKLHGTLDSVVLARLSRAAMRYVWKVDVTDIKSNQGAIQSRLNAWRNTMSRGQTFGGSPAQSDAYTRPSTIEDDIFVPSADGLAYGVDTVDGDTNLSRVQDIEMLTRFYFGALGVPAQYLGHESSQGGRSNMSQIDINFARTCRHIQMFGAAGFAHIVLVDLMLGGYDPDKFPFEIVPPRIGARDDLLQAQIMMIQSTVISNLRAAGMNMEINPKWVLRTFLNLDEELEELGDGEIDELFQNAGIEDPGKDEPSKPDRRAIEAVIQKTRDTMPEEVLQNINLLATGRDSFVEQGIGFQSTSLSDLVTSYKLTSITNGR